MARELVPIKVKILLNPDNGYAKYPDFQELQVLGAINWTSYVDNFGIGWHYDSVSGMMENTPDSPAGQQWGILVVPQEFADQAVAMFSNEVTKLTEVELETFWNDKAHVNEADETIDATILDGIKAKQDLGLDLTEQQIKALDPNDPTPGVVKNEKRYWSDYKTKLDISIV